MIRRAAHPASSCLPGFGYAEAAHRLLRGGLGDPMLESVSPERMQLCPQQRGWLSREACAGLRERHPQTEFRLHANARLRDKLERFDAGSDLRAEGAGYALRLKRACGWLGSAAYTYHAPPERIGWEAMRANALRLEDFLGIPVGVEGLYPSGRPGRDPMLSTLAEYERLLGADFGFALDLSHLQIVCEAEGAGLDSARSLARALLESPRCREAHVSDNDLRRDSHRALETERWWMGVLDAAELSPGCALFCESDQRGYLRRGRSAAAA